MTVEIITYKLKYDSRNYNVIQSMCERFTFTTSQLNSTQVYWIKVAGWLKEIQYIKTNKMIKVKDRFNR